MNNIKGVQWLCCECQKNLADQPTVIVDGKEVARVITVCDMPDPSRDFCSWECLKKYTIKKLA